MVKVLFIWLIFSGVIEYLPPFNQCCFKNFEPFGNVCFRKMSAKVLIFSEIVNPTSFSLACVLDWEKRDKLGLSAIR